MMGFPPNALRDEQGAQGTQEALTLSFSNSPLMTHDCMSREHDTLLTACPHGTSVHSWSGAGDEEERG